MIKCMALNRKMTARCYRKATKMLAAQPVHPHSGKPRSIATVRLCGLCNRSLHSGSRSLQLELDDGTRHTVIAGDGIGEIWVMKDRDEA